VRERESKQASRSDGRGAEGEADSPMSREPDVGLDRSQDPWIMT